MPSCGKAAARTALPHPPNVSQKVPKNSATERRTVSWSNDPPTRIRGGDCRSPFNWNRKRRDLRRDHFFGTMPGRRGGISGKRRPGPSLAASMRDPSPTPRALTACPTAPTSGSHATSFRIVINCPPALRASRMSRGQYQAAVMPPFFFKRRRPDPNRLRQRRLRLTIEVQPRFPFPDRPASRSRRPRTGWKRTGAG